MHTEDIVCIVKTALGLSYDEWKKNGEPVRPESDEEALLIAQAMIAVLDDMIAQRKKETQ
jgi:hypothetical protein